MKRGRLRAALIWGDRLFKRGRYVSYKSAGLGCIGQALSQYQRLYSKDVANNPARKAAAEALYASYLSVSKAWNKKEKIFRRVQPVADPADLWNVAEHDKDRAWQLEGLLWLGVAKWTECGTGPRRDACQKYLVQKSVSATDPVIAARAKMAADFPRTEVGSIASPTLSPLPATAP